MRLYSEVHTVVAVIVNDKNEILIGKRIYINGRLYSNYWDGPGGRVEEGESLPDALRREVREETGMQIKSSILISIYHNYWKRLLGQIPLMNAGYLAEVTDHTITARDDLAGLQWTTIAEIKKLKITPWFKYHLKCIGLL